MMGFWKDRRVLIAGHTGFKGSWLTLWLLKNGAHIHGLSLTEAEEGLFRSLGLAQQLGDRHHKGDLLDSQSLSQAVVACQPEVIIHLAAQQLVRVSYRDPLTTWSTNVLGTLQLLDKLKILNQKCVAVMVTTDKVYTNKEWDYGYRENDRLGGHDPYSASKAAAELAVASWRVSFCGSAAHQTPYLAIGTARAGNVIGGGDWVEDRIVPYAMCALATGNPIPLRNPAATRPWQHVLEPLAGYPRLSEALYTSHLDPGSWRDQSDPHAPHEAGRLHLQIDKAHHQLGWRPRWDFATTVARIVGWYRAVHEGANPLDCCLADLKAYEEHSSYAN